MDQNSPQRLSLSVSAVHYITVQYCTLQDGTVHYCKLQYITTLSEIKILLPILIEAVILTKNQSSRRSGC